MLVSVVNSHEALQVCGLYAGVLQPTLAFIHCCRYLAPYRLWGPISSQLMENIKSLEQFPFLGFHHTGTAVDKKNSSSMHTFRAYCRQHITAMCAMWAGHVTFPSLGDA